MTDRQRALDLVIALPLLALSAPIQLAAAVAVRCSSPGPILHRAVRIGRHGVPFTLFKFRSMHLGAATAGPAITAGEDPRVTAVGRLLRRTKVDELPQLFNVLRGEMSLVGPRPEDPRYVEGYTEDQRRVLDARPGITGPASLAYRHEETLLAGADDLDAAYAEIMADKIRIDLDYIARRTVRSDLAVLAGTLRALARRSR